MNKESNKHAMLIMAHTNWGQLTKLLKLLDDERNDIYLHIDANSDKDAFTPPKKNFN